MGEEGKHSNWVRLILWPKSVIGYKGLHDSVLPHEREGGRGVIVAQCHAIYRFTESRGYSPSLESVRGMDRCVHMDCCLYFHCPVDGWWCDEFVCCDTDMKVFPLRNTG